MMKCFLLLGVLLVPFGVPAIASDIDDSDYEVRYNILIKSFLFLQCTNDLLMILVCYADNSKLLTEVLNPVTECQLYPFFFEILLALSIGLNAGVY